MSPPESEKERANLAEVFVVKLYDLLKALPGIQGTLPAKKRAPDQTKIERWDLGLRVFKGDIKGDAELHGQSIVVNLSLKTRVARKPGHWPRAITIPGRTWMPTWISCINGWR